MPLAPSVAGVAGRSVEPPGARLVVTHHLFVYGTLRPGEVRWVHLAPFVVGDGVDTTVAGDVYDTGLEYPAAMFGGEGRIIGRVYELTRLDEARANVPIAEAKVAESEAKVQYHSARIDRLRAMLAQDAAIAAVEQGETK